MLRRFLSFLWNKKSLKTKFENVCKDMEIHEKSLNMFSDKLKNLNYWILFGLITFYLPVFIVSYLFMDNYHFKFLCSFVLVLSPTSFFVFRNFFRWYYGKKISKLNLKLKELENLKEQMITYIMENETYKNVNDLLTKYAPERLNLNIKTEIEENDSKSMPSPIKKPSVTVKQPLNQVSVTEVEDACIPRPFVSANGGFLGRVLDFALGDGPQNRYALICHKCHIHNGMALSDDLGTFVYRCYYCKTMNFLSFAGNIPAFQEEIGVESSKGSNEPLEDIKIEDPHLNVDMKVETDDELVISDITEDISVSKSGGGKMNDKDSALSNTDGEYMVNDSDLKIRNTGEDYKMTHKGISVNSEDCKINDYAVNNFGGDCKMSDKDTHVSTISGDMSATDGDPIANDEETHMSKIGGDFGKAKEGAASSTSGDYCLNDKRKILTTTNGPYNVDDKETRLGTTNRDYNESDNDGPLSKAGEYYNVDDKNDIFGCN